MTPQETIATLRRRYGNITASEFAARLGVAVHHAAWQTTAGQIVQFAECTRQPRQITLNDAVIEWLATMPVATNEQPWFTRAQITEVILAHELFHLLMPAPSLWTKHSAIETAAHAFAQGWTKLPFHPTRYEQMLWATFSA